MTREAVVALLTAAKEPETPKSGAQIADLEETRVVLNGGRIDCENVCGLWPGSDPALAEETILVTAHYDHVGVINGEIYNGADDNGSGTCGLMAIAEALTKAGPMRRSVMLMWVSGEEKGLWGSKAWTENPFLPGDHKPICDINIDMIGRNAPEKLLVTPTKDRPKDYNGLTRLAERLAPLEGFPTLGSADEYYTRSDHYNFAKMGLPVTFLFDDVHEDYHRPTDDVDKIDYDKIRRVVRLVVRMLDGLQVDRPELK
jgi:Zn-dependent M28 family amino/carboxypeptidase